MTEHLEIIDLLEKNGFFEQSDSMATALTCRCPQVRRLAVFQRLQPLCCPKHRETTLKSRISNLEYCLDSTHTDFAPMFEEILSPDWSTKPDEVCNFDVEYTPLQAICRFYLMRDKIPSTPRVQRLAIKVIQTTRDIHRFSPNVNTPLAEMIRGCQYVNHADGANEGLPAVRRIEAAVKSWLQLLEEARVDISQYGRRELQLLQGNQGWEPPVGVFQRALKDTIMTGSMWWPISFEIASARDFHFYWNEATDDFAGDFWHLVEEPIWNMPGKWID